MSRVLPAKISNKFPIQQHVVGSRHTTLAHIEFAKLNMNHFGIGLPSFSSNQSIPRSDSQKKPHLSLIKASLSGDASNGKDEENANKPPSDSKLGDWREFRARLIRDYSNLTDSGSSKSTSPESVRTESTSLNRTESPIDSPSEKIAEDPFEESLESPKNFNTDSFSKLEPNIKSWAHPLTVPEQGCIVIAHPNSFGARQQYFHQAVIFLFAHGEEGSAGVILNRPSEYTLGQLAGSEDFLPEFHKCPLYIGGDVGEKCTYVIHGIPDLEESKEIISGVYLSGYSSIKEHVQNNKSSFNDYKWFARYAGWGPGQLLSEVEAGVWFLGSCSKDLILKHCVDLEKPLWQEVMELMGGKYKKLSDRVYGDF